MLFTCRSTTNQSTGLVLVVALHLLLLINASQQIYHRLSRGHQPVRFIYSFVCSSFVFNHLLSSIIIVDISINSYEKNSIVIVFDEFQRNLYELEHDRLIGSARRWILDTLVVSTRNSW
jgi:hypothetical protein